MASIKKRGEKYLVRWRTLDGAERGRTCPDHATAKHLRAEVERAHALGTDWAPEEPKPTLSVLELDEEDRLTGGLFADFMEARRPALARGTARHYDRALRRFAAWLADRNPRARSLSVDLITRDALQGWFGFLVDEERGDDVLDISSARLMVTAVFSAWEWAEDSDRYGEHVKRPRRPTLPTPRRSPAVAPTWAQMDQVISAAYGLAAATTHDRDRRGYLWRGRLLMLLRYTGLRVDEQAMQLLWSDVDLDRGELLIRGELGKSDAEKEGRIMPLSSHLLEAMKGWGVRDGYLLAPHKKDRHSDPRTMTEIWEASKVPERVWGAVSGRSKAPVHHAFRKGFKTGLSDLGVEPGVRDFLVGHHRGIDENYIDLARKARDAVERIPPLSDEAASGEIIAFPQRARS